MVSQKQTLVDFVASLADALLATSNYLDGAKRSGADVDDPEGARYVVFSDTLIREWSNSFRGIAYELGAQDGTTTTEQHMVRSGKEEQGERGQPDAGPETGSADAVAGGEPDPVL